MNTITEFFGKDGEVKGEMARFLRDRYFWYVVALLALPGVFVYLAQDYFLDRMPSELEQHSAYMVLMTLRSFLLLLAVALAAWRFGVRGGLAACLIIGLILAPHIINETAEHPSFDTLIHYGIWGVVWVGTGWLVGTRKRVAEALRASEERYRTILDGMMEGCQIIGFDWRYMYLNDVAIGHSHRSREELLGHTMMEMYPGIEDTEMFANLRRCMEKRVPHRMENIFTFPDGSQGWFGLSIEPVPEGIFVLSIDITERKQAEDERRLLLEMTQAIAEAQDYYTSLELILRKVCEATGWNFGEAWVPSRDGKVLEHSCSVSYSSSHRLEEFRQFSKGMTFLPKTGLPGRVWSSKQPEWVSDVSRQPEAVFLRAEAASKAGLKAGVGVPVIVDGQVLAVLVFYMFESRQEDKRLVEAISGVARQLGSAMRRRWTEEALARAAREWETTFSAVTDLVSIIAKDFKIVRVNKAYADFFKMKPEELVGKYCYEVFHGTKEPAPFCPHANMLETRKPARAEFYEPHRGVYFEATTSPIFNEKGEMVASAHIVRDITERKRMEENLIVTDRLASVGELAAGVAHELNNPLTGVIGFSELLLEKKDVPLDIREDIAIIHREAKRTAEIVKNLLIFAGKHPLAQQPLDINSIIAGVLALRAYEQKVNNIKVITRLAPNLPQVTADPFQLQQVFLNIIINAEYFMSEAHSKGTIVITTARVGDVVRASFADDGPGIAKEKLGHIFDPFFTTKEVGRGTGLGLSICHGMVAEHGGKIYAESQLGKGATFIVELPLKIVD